MLLSFHMTSPNGFISEPRLYLLLVCISLTLMFVSMNKRLLYIFSLRVNPSSGLIWYAVFWVFLLLPSKHIAECHILFIFGIKNFLLCFFFCCCLLLYLSGTASKAIDMKNWNRHSTSYTYLFCLTHSHRK